MPTDKKTKLAELMRRCRSLESDLMALKSDFSDEQQEALDAADEALHNAHNHMKFAKLTG